MDVCIIIKQRLEELGLEQKDLAAAAGVTDSYISQLLARKKLPPAPDRNDIYSKIGKFLSPPVGKLSELAGHQRAEELKKELSEPPVPLFKEVRELVLRKCRPEKQGEIRSIFARQPFGELERPVTHKLLDPTGRASYFGFCESAAVRMLHQGNSCTEEITSHGGSTMDPFVRQELVEAGLRLRDAISRVVKESPECLRHKHGKWSFEFRNPTTGEGIVVTYAGPTMPLHQN